MTVGAGSDLPPPPPSPPPPNRAPARARRFPPGLLAAEVSRLQPLLPARLTAVLPVAGGWRFDWLGPDRAHGSMLASFLAGAVGLLALDQTDDPLPPPFAEPPPAQRWLADLVGARAERIIAWPQEPIALVGFAAAAGSSAQTLVLELFGATGNAVLLQRSLTDAAAAGLPIDDAQWLEGPILRSIHPTRTAARSLEPNEPYRLPHPGGGRGGLGGRGGNGGKGRGGNIDTGNAVAGFAAVAAARDEFIDHLHARCRTDALDSFTRPLEAERTRLLRRVGAIRAQGGSAEDIARAVLEGQYLQAHPQRAVRGFQTVDPRPDHAAWGLERPIPVRPDLTLLENAGKIFDRVHKWRKAAEYARTALPPLERALADLAARQANLDDLATLPWPDFCDRVESIRAADPAAASPARVDSSQRRRAGQPANASAKGAAHRAAKASTQGPAGAAGDGDAPNTGPAPGPKFVRRFVSADGFVIDVGRSARDNHRLTFQTAQGNDLLLHVAGAPGAHVLVRCGRKLAKGQDPEFPAATLLEAARLCLHFSSRKAIEGEVVYALRKHCRAGAHPGEVYIARPNYLRVRADETALKVVLDRMVR
ncbi:MAG: hypothetical protein ACREJ2_05985 [Planctomycetota bacterium]